MFSFPANFTRFSRVSHFIRVYIYILNSPSDLDFCLNSFYCSIYNVFFHYTVLYEVFSGTYCTSNALFSIDCSFYISVNKMIVLSFNIWTLLLYCKTGLSTEFKFMVNSLCCFCLFPLEIKLGFIFNVPLEENAWNSVSYTR